VSTRVSVAVSGRWCGIRTIILVQWQTTTYCSGMNFFPMGLCTPFKREQSCTVTIARPYVKLCISVPFVYLSVCLYVWNNSVLSESSQRIVKIFDSLLAPSLTLRLWG